MGPKSNESGVFIRRWEDTETQTESCKVKMEAEIEVKSLQSKRMIMINGNHQKLGDRSGTVSPSESTERTNHTDNLIANFYHSPICLFHPSYLICLHTLLFIVFNYNYVYFFKVGSDASFGILVFSDLSLLSLFFCLFVCLRKIMLILLIFTKNQFLVALIVLIFSYSHYISFFLLFLGLFLFSFSSVLM